jgi:hypothetical protein
MSLGVPSAGQRSLSMTLMTSVLITKLFVNICLLIGGPADVILIRQADFDKESIYFDQRGAERLGWTIR